MSHHGREGEPSHSEAEWHDACGRANNARDAIRRACEEAATARMAPAAAAEMAITNLRFFAVQAGIIPDPEEVRRQKEARKLELLRQRDALNAELAKLG